MKAMLRRFVSLMLLIAFCGAVTQSAAFAAQGGDPQMHGMMTGSASADCMDAMKQGVSHAAHATRHKDCAPGSCSNFMLACSGLAALPVGEGAPPPRHGTPSSIRHASFERVLTGTSRLPDIRPPIA
jgi:hypothetical protein